MAGVDNDPSSAEGKLAPGATSDFPVPLPPLPFRLPAEEPPLGVPDDEAADFMERRKLAHRLAELSGEHLQVWGKCGGCEAPTGACVGGGTCHHIVLLPILIPTLILPCPVHPGHRAAP